jgi:hypothetical protein
MRSAAAAGAGLEAAAQQEDQRQPLLLQARLHQLWLQEGVLLTAWPFL